MANHDIDWYTRWIHCVRQFIYCPPNCTLFLQQMANKSNSALIREAVAWLKCSLSEADNCGVFNLIPLNNHPPQRTGSIATVTVCIQIICRPISHYARTLSTDALWWNDQSVLVLAGLCHPACTLAALKTARKRPFVHFYPSWLRRRSGKCSSVGCRAAGTASAVIQCSLYP